MSRPVAIATLILLLLLPVLLAACGGDAQPEDTRMAPTTVATTASADPTPAETPAGQSAAPATVAPAATTTATTAPAATNPPRQQPTEAAATRVPTAASPATRAPVPAATEVPAEQPTEPPAPTATSAPKPETGGVCDRHPSVQQAIIAATPPDSCSQVTDEHLAAITTLEGISVERLTAEETAGLTALESLSVTVSTMYYDFARLTSLKDLDLTIAFGEQRLGPYDLPIFNLDEVEHNPEPFGVSAEDESHHLLESLKITYKSNDDNRLRTAPWDFASPAYPARHIHIVLTGPDAQSLFAPHQYRYPTFHPSDSLTLEINPDPPYAEGSRGSGQRLFDDTDNPSRIVVLNKSDLTAGFYKDSLGPFTNPVELEMRGRIEFAYDAFVSYRNITRIDLDLDEGEFLHYLRDIPDHIEGTGFTPDN